jgi:hypothetical protein
MQKIREGRVERAPYLMTKQAHAAFAPAAGSWRATPRRGHVRLPSPCGRQPPLVQCRAADREREIWNFVIIRNRVCRFAIILKGFARIPLSNKSHMHYLYTTYRCVPVRSHGS